MLLPRVALSSALAIVSFANSAFAQQPVDPLTGYIATNAAAQRRLEREAISRPKPAAAAGHARALSREPHMAGTPAQARTRDYVIGRMHAWGMETEVRAYEIWMPEGAVPGDSTSLLSEVPPITATVVVGTSAPKSYTSITDSSRTTRRGFVRRVGSRQDRDRAVWPLIPRHQGA